MGIFADNTGDGRIEEKGGGGGGGRLKGSNLLSLSYQLAHSPAVCVSRWGGGGGGGGAGNCRTGEPVTRLEQSRF